MNRFRRPYSFFKFYPSKQLHQQQFEMNLKKFKAYFKRRRFTSGPWLKLPCQSALLSWLMSDFFEFGRHVVFRRVYVKFVSRKNFLDVIF